LFDDADEADAVNDGALDVATAEILSAPTNNPLADALERPPPPTFEDGLRNLAERPLLRRELDEAREVRLLQLLKSSPSSSTTIRRCAAAVTAAGVGATHQLNAFAFFGFRGGLMRID
jgi:hypothetical protein